MEILRIKRNKFKLRDFFKLKDTLFDILSIARLNIYIILLDYYYYLLVEIGKVFKINCIRN